MPDAQGHAADRLAATLGATRSGDGWMAKCVLPHNHAHNDRTPSLAISRGDNGKPVIHCHAGCVNDDIIAELRKRGLWQTNGHAPEHDQPRKPRSRPTPKPIVPVPADAPDISTYEPQNLGRPDRLWAYDDADGHRVGYFARWDRAGGKETRPVTFCDLGADRRGWVAQGFPKPRPLYRLPIILKHADATVLVCEGEKAADAAQRLFPNHVATTSVGGAKAAAGTDWRPLAGRKIIIWPDNDEAGAGYATAVSELVRAAGATRITKVDIPTTFPRGWDLADPVPAGADLAQLLRDDAETGDWYERVMCGTRGNVLNNIANALLAMRDDPYWHDRLTFNAFTQVELLDGKPIEDHHLVDAQTWLQMAGLQVMPLSTASAAMLRAARDHSFHPIRDWLERLEWDREERLSRWLHRWAGAEDSEYTRAIGRMFTIGMVARVMRPGCKMDYAPVIRGITGIGKSGLCRLLAGGEEFFSDSLPDDLSKKDAMDHLAGRWVIELPEMSFMRKSEREVAKRFLSKQADAFRPAYGRREVNRLRQNVFVGTTEEEHFLEDPKGNRRFWPLHSTRIDFDLAAKERDQLFAEALFAYRNDEKWWPTPELERWLLAPEQAKFLAHHPWLTVIEV